MPCIVFLVIIILIIVIFYLLSPAFALAFLMFFSSHPSDVPLQNFTNDSLPISIEKQTESNKLSTDMPNSELKKIPDSLSYAPKLYNEKVTELQRMLNYWGANIDEDGFFGDKTFAAVKDFQKRNGLVVDGKVGAKTWEALQLTRPSY